MNDSLLLFVGCLNREAPYMEGARGKGIAVFSFDDMTGEGTLLSETDDIDNPAFLSISPDGRTLFAGSEVFNRREGIAAAYAVDAATGTLTYLNMQPTLGSICAFNALSGDGRHLLLANYGMGAGGPDRSVAVLPVAPDGHLSPASDSAVHEGTGPDQVRQERAHAHCLQPVGDMLLCADLGLDRILAYRLDAEGRLTRLAETAVAPGAGPRHIAASADGDHVFVINELDSTVQSFLHDGSGGLSPVSTCPALPPGVTGSHCADLHLSPDDRFLYASNRGHDSLAIFSVESGTAALTALGHVPSGGKTPRSFALTPSGRHVLVANQNSDEIAVFRRAPNTGGIEATGQRIPVGTPLCVKVAAR